jgi:hypothetical protein
MFVELALVVLCHSWCHDGSTLKGPALHGTRVYTQDGAILAVDVSPDSKSIVFGDEHGVVRVWDVARNRIKHSFRLDWPTNSSPKVVSLSFSGDGTALAAGTDTGFIYIWETSTWQRRLTKKVGEVFEMAYGPNAGKLVAATAAGLFVFPLVGKGREIRLKGHTHMVVRIALTMDGAMLASTGPDGMIKLWNVENCKESAGFQGNAFLGEGPLVISPDKKTLIWNKGGKSLMMWDIDRGRDAGVFKELSAPVCEIAITADGNLVAGVSDNIAIWMVESRKLLGQAQYEGRISSVKFAPDGSALITSSIRAEVTGRKGDIVVYLVGQREEKQSGRSCPVENPNRIAACEHPMLGRNWKKLAGSRQGLRPGAPTDPYVPDLGIRFVTDGATRPANTGRASR